MVSKEYVPLPNGFMFSSLVGLMVSVLFVWKISETWGFTFILFFIIMFIASVISMSKADAYDKYHLEELAIHEKIHNPKKRTIKKK